MPDIQLNAQSLTTTSATTSPSSGTSETWSVTALGAGIPALGSGQSFALVDATSGATTSQQSEIVRVTACTGTGATSITVTRGADGTTPVAHAGTSTFNVVVVAAALNNAVGATAPPSYVGARTKVFDPALSLYNSGSATLRAARNLVARARQGGTGRVTCIGDSTTAGSGATDASTSYPRQLLSVLEASGCAVRGTGLVFAGQGVTDPRWSKTGTTTDFGSYSQMSATATKTFVSDRKGTNVDLRFYANSSTFSITVDGYVPASGSVSVTNGSYSAGTVTPSGTTVGGLVTITGLADSVHTIVVTAVGGTVYYIGADVYESTGVQVSNVGVASTKSGDWTSTAFASNYQMATMETTDLFVVALGINDASAAVALATFKSNVTTLVTNLLTIAPVLLVAQHNSSAVSAATERTYVSALYDVADSMDVPVIDVMYRWNDYATANTAGLIADTVHPNSRGYADWAQAVFNACGFGAPSLPAAWTNANTSYAALTSLGTEGLPLWGYGNSYLANTGNAFGIFYDRIRRRGRFGSWFNAGVGGYLMGDICQRAYGNFTAPSQGTLETAPFTPPNIAGTWTPAALKGGVVLIEPFRNDASFDGISTAGSTTAKARAAATNGLKAFIAMMRAGSAIDDGDGSITYGGGWSVVGSLNNVYGTSVHYTTTVGSQMSRAITVPASGEIDVVMLAVDDFAMVASGGAAGAPYKITCTGKADITGTSSNQHRITGHGPNANYSLLVERITGLTPGGSVTVTLEKTGAADSSILWFDCFLLPTATPPTVIVYKPGLLTAAQYATIAAGGGTGASAATDAIYGGIVDTVVAQFPADQSVIALDPNTAGFNAATMISNADGLNVHLNDLGNSCYADLAMGTLYALPARAGLQTTLTVTPATPPGGLATLDSSGTLQTTQIPASLARNAANGVAPLDGSGLLPAANLPATAALKTDVAKNYDVFTAPSTFWQTPAYLMGTGTATAVTSGNLTFLPIDVGPSAKSFSAIGVGVGATVQSGGTTTTTLAIYPDDGTGGRPLCTGGPTASATIVLTGTANSNHTGSITTTLQPGRYWVAFLYFETVAATTKALVYMITNAISGPIASGSVIGNVVGRGWLIASSTAMPTTDVRASMTSIGGTQAPIVALQAT